MRIWGGYLLVLMAWVVTVMALAFLGFIICASITWQPSPLYDFLNWVRDYIVLVCIVTVLAGWVVISFYFISKPIKQLDVVANAAEQLSRPSEEPIQLPDSLEDISIQLNLAREQALRDARAAREAEQRKNDLIVYLAHDLKTPLTSVIGYLTLLRDEPQISPEIRARYTGIALEKAERPVLMVGGGAQHAHAELLAFAEKTGLPVITTLMGLGAFPGNHPLWLGMPGMHGTVAANRAIHHADVILAIGLRFDDRVTGKVSRFAPHAHTIIHVDIDPAEIGKVVRTHIPIVGDSRLVLKELLKGAKALRLAAWWRELEEWRTRYPLRYRPKPHLQSQEVIRAFYEATGGHAIVTTGVGQHQMFAAQFFPVTRPRSFLTSGGLGTMGVGLPFAIGAKIARPEELVIDFDGDGSFQMTLQELATVVKYKLDVKVVILNNGYLGMVRQWQDLFHAKRYSEVYLADSNPDFARLAEAYGIKGVRVERKEDLMKGGEAVLNADGPVVAEFKVYQEEGVFPMIPAGGAAEDMILEPPEEKEEVGA